MQSGRTGFILNAGDQTVPDDLVRLGMDTAYQPRIPREECIVARTRSQSDCTDMGVVTMAEIPLHWRVYAAHQSRLDNRSAADSVAWGSEAALNFLLETGNLIGAAGAADRVASAGARRSRYSRALLAKFIIGADDGVERGRIEAQSELSDLRRSLPADLLDLLVATAVGIEPAEIAMNSQVSTGCIRARICRARQVARNIAA